MDVSPVENDGPAHFVIDGATLWAAAMLEENKRTACLAGGVQGTCGPNQSLGCPA